MAKHIENPVGQTELTLLTGTIKPHVGDLIGFTTGWVFADADARISAEYMCMSGEGDSASTTGPNIINVCTAGILVDDTAPFVLGGAQYLSSTGTTGNTVTATIPAASTTLTVLQKVGVAISTSVMSFDLSRRSTLMRVQATYDPGSLGGVTAQSDTITVTGLLTTDVIRGQTVAGPLTGTGWNSGLVIQSYDVSAADTLRVRLTNPTAGALDGASVTLTLLVERL